MAYVFSRMPCRLLGVSSTTTIGTIDLNDAFTMYSGGDVVGCRFTAPVTQTNAALVVYAYCTALSTATVTDVRCGVYAGPSGTEDVDRPANAADIGHVHVDLSGVTAPDWITFTIASVSLTAGQTYYILLDNLTSTPATHYPTFAINAALVPLTNLGIKCFQAMSATNGFSADGTAASAQPAMVIKFSDGSLLGNPYVALGSAHANNTNSRGMCFTPSEDIVVSGCAWNGTSASINGFKIRLASDHTDVVTGVVDRAGNQTTYSGTRFAPTTLTGGTRYEIVATFGGNSATGTIYTMGEASPPTDVQNCTWPGAGYIDDATIDPLSLMAFLVLVDDNPAIAASGGVFVTKQQGIGV
jgi:hypothetical protein